ncbi:hypothetical protein B296_00007694 [Ensete ventricosum]|uniref:Uncharacterized protein n=1 Tax=Ensete ventricosum TaxID=4639 RepID=A0A427B3G5_ENSVE|nr:hypothetical protein B296_00007694 [Ensete ventricosum]
MQTFCYSFVTDFTCLCDVASRSADQQFEVGTREFVDVFACVQYKDEQKRLFFFQSETFLRMIRQSMAAGIKANIRSRYDPISADNHNAEEWIEDPGLTEGEGINLLDVAQLDTSVSTAERLCNRSDDNFGNNDETVNGSDKAVYSADSSN